MMPENRGCDEPQYMTAHYVKHILPDVKIMVILRNPIDRFVNCAYCKHLCHMKGRGDDVMEWCI